MINLFKKKKQCDVCGEKYPADETFHELRMNVQEGEVTLKICVACTDFFDKSADIINGKRDDEPV
jgi:hypothetical protein